MTDRSLSRTSSRPSAFSLAVVLTGVGAGLGGMALALLLHAIQHLAYGYDIGQLVGHESFLMGVSGASPLRRLAALGICGVVAGAGWALLYRYGRPLVSIRKAVGAADPRMPVASTMIHALLQIVTVALGSPLGREVAPREIGSLLAGHVAHRAGLSPDDCRLMVACGAGAGLAAVYNVPLGGAIFALEVLLCTYAPRALIAALVTSALAALTAWIGLGNEQQYTVPAFALNGPLLVWAATCGPLFGIAAWGFVKLTSSARAHVPRGWKLFAMSMINFSVIGGLVLVFPHLAGNGKGAASMAFDDRLTLGLATALLVLKVAIEASSLRSGAEGGLLTPGLANGALLAVVLGGLWNHMLPGVSTGACALIGAGAFLSASMQMPLTAVVLLAELTRADHDLLYPLLLAIAGSLLAYRAAPVLFTAFGTPKPAAGSVGA